MFNIKAITLPPSKLAGPPSVSSLTEGVPPQFTIEGTISLKNFVARF